MAAQNSPFVEATYGWPYGSSGWNQDMDQNLVKFSYLHDRNIDAIVSSLPAIVNGKAYFNTTDNRLYFDANGQRYSSVTPKWFEVTLRTTGEAYQFNGTTLILIDPDLPTETFRTELAAPTGSSELGFSGDQPTVEAALISRAKGNSGKTYNLIGAAVRRDTSISTDWQLVSDSAHIPINMSSPTNGVELQLNYTGSKIGTLVVGADERMAACGVVAGGSVGASTAFLRMGAPCSFTVDLATLAIGIDTRFYRAGRFGVSISGTGLITLTHPQRQMNLMPIIQYYTDSSSSELMFPFDIRGSSVGISTLYIKRRFAGRINYTGSAWGTSNSPFNASITSTYDTGTGTLTVTHPTITGNVQPVVTPYSAAADEYFVSALNSTGTGFQVKFRKVTDGSIPVGTPTGMGFYFDRGITAIDPIPSGKLHIHLGHVQVDMNDVDFPLANIWPLAVMEA